MNLVEFTLLSCPLCILGFEIQQTIQYCNLQYNSLVSPKLLAQEADDGHNVFDVSVLMVQLFYCQKQGWRRGRGSLPVLYRSLEGTPLSHPRTNLGYEPLHANPNFIENTYLVTSSYASPQLTKFVQRVDYRKNVFIQNILQQRQ